MPRGRALLVAFTFTLAACGSCDRWEKKLEARRIELSESAKACPAPTTCTEKHHGDGGHDYKVCTAASGEQTYAAGDIVLIHEIGLDMIALIKEAKGGSSYTVEFADRTPLTRSSSSIIKRVCN
jgi:hypothetical protein